MTEQKQPERLGFWRRLATIISLGCQALGCNPARSDGADVQRSSAPLSSIAETARAPTPVGRRHVPVGSLLQLITRPEEHDNARVLVSGYFVVEGDGGLNGLLFPTEEHARWGLDSCLGVRLGPCQKSQRFSPALEPSDVDEYEKTYVMIGGTFEATPGAVYPGTICGVTRMDLKSRSSHFSEPEVKASAR